MAGKEGELGKRLACIQLNKGGCEQLNRFTVARRLPAFKCKHKETSNWRSSVRR